ncbi:hypothetical protein DK875_04675 [Streptococcus suis]|nr:hypothetical protein DK875_04675 [Streptococcus suis]
MVVLCSTSGNQRQLKSFSNVLENFSLYHGLNIKQAQNGLVFYHLSSSSRYLTKNILCLVIQIRKLFSFGLKLRVKKSTRNEHLMLKIFDKVLQ